MVISNCSRDSITAWLIDEEFLQKQLHFSMRIELKQREKLFSVIITRARIRGLVILLAFTYSFPFLLPQMIYLIYDYVFHVVLQTLAYNGYKFLYCYFSLAKSILTMDK